VVVDEPFHSPQHILIIDDDECIRTLLSDFLYVHFYMVSGASDTSEADKLLGLFKFDLIILDVLMNPEDGTTYIKRIRNKVEAPIIMLTALNTPEHRITGLENGADDYLGKPFEPKELLLRIKNLTSRKGGWEQSRSIKTGAKFGEFDFNLGNTSLKRSEEYVYITTIEAKLLGLFAKRASEIISRSEVISYLMGVKDALGNNVQKDSLAIKMNARTVDTQIARLRVRIEKDPKKPEFLQTVRGAGYVLWATPY